MAISVDPGTKVITVLQADLTPLGGDSYQMDTNWFRLQLRDWEDSPEGIVHPKTHLHNTSVLLDGIEYARIIEIINGYTVTFEETGTPYKVFLIGSNNNILTVTNLGTVQVAPSNSAGLINISEVQFAAFGDGVTYDEVNGMAGTGYPMGSKFSPVNNLIDAKTIAAGRGFDHIYINGNLSNGTESISGFHLYGDGATLNQTKTLVTLGGGSTSGTFYHDCRITGAQSGESNYFDCIIDGLSNAHCHYERCGIIDGTALGYSVQQGTVSTGHTSYWHECYGDEGVAIIDRNSTKMNMVMDGWNGRIKFINQNRAYVSESDKSGSVYIHVNGGTVEIDSSCTEGTIFVTGDFELINNSGGTQVKTGIFRKLDEIKFSIENLRTTHQGFGDMYFVDPVNGLDTHDGKSPNTPLKTFAAAHALCNDGGNDIIQFFNPSNASYNHVEDMVITKNNVHVRASSRDITFKPATPGGAVLTVGDATGTNGYGCSVTGMLIDGAKGEGTSAVNCILIHGKFCLLLGVWLKQSTGSCLKIMGGDYHVIVDGEIEKANLHGIETEDGDLPSGSPREITIHGRSNIYLNAGNGIHIGADAGDALGTTTRIVRVLTGEITLNGGFGIYADATVQHVTIGAAVVVHGNNGGDANPQTSFLTPEYHLESYHRSHETAAAVWDHEKDMVTLPGSMGEFVKNKLLTVGKFLGLK